MGMCWESQHYNSGLLVESRLTNKISLFMFCTKETFLIDVLVAIYWIMYEEFDRTWHFYLCTSSNVADFSQAAKTHIRPHWILATHTMSLKFRTDTQVIKPSDTFGGWGAAVDLDGID